MRSQRSKEDQALAKYRALVPYLQGIASLKSIAEEQGINVRTVRRWLQAIDTRGFSGLCRATRSDKGSRCLPDELRELIEGLYLRRPRPQVSTIYRKIKGVCAQRAWKLPSYSTVYAIVRELEPGIVTLAHEGRKVYHETFDLILTREADRPNQIWQSDHKQLDVFVLDETGQPVRPWLTAIIDDFSRTIPGYFIGPEAPSIVRTALALRQGIWKKPQEHWSVCGIPDEFYVDHGCDFTSRHLEQVAADLKITLTFSRVGEPRGRGKIERFFRTVNQLLCSELPGFIAPGGKKQSELLTLGEFEQLFHCWLLNEYMQRIHSELGTSPAAKWLDDGFIPRLPDSLDQLDHLLLTIQKQRIIRQDGIHFNTLRYTNLALLPFVRRRAVIRYDPRNMTEIKVYLNDAFLCTAVSDCSLSISELTRARKHRRKELEREINARSELVKHYMESAGYREIESRNQPSRPPSELGLFQKQSRLKIYATDLKVAKT